jgi:hypothetical protein
MIYLIDGHNLIGQLPDMTLGEPDDEAKLILKLASFCARTQRRCLVVFDHGLPGGSSRMSTQTVQVVFASARSTADRVMVERMKKFPNPREWVVVSSDREVLAVARVLKMETIHSDVFARMMQSPPKPDIDIGSQADVKISAQEVDEWLDIFGKGS